MSKRNLFEKRVNLKPYEYPELLPFRDAIRASYWLHSEFNFSSDIQDYRINVTPAEKSVLTKAMLAIAQVEVTVKRFWTDIYRYFPKPEIDEVGVTFAECHVEGTEILTPKGWVDFRYIEKGDLICQFIPSNNTCEFVPAVSVTKQYYSGPVISLKKRTWVCDVTPNHGILDYDHFGNARVRLAKDYIGEFGATKPFAALLIGSDDKLSPLDRLKIAIQADATLRTYKNKVGDTLVRGSSKGVNTYLFQFRKERKMERLLKILSETNVNYRIWENDSTYMIDVDMPPGDYKNFDWVDLYGKSCYWCNDFVWELLHWDGNLVPKHKGNCDIKYSTTNKRCVDKVQAIGTVAGYQVGINTYTPKNGNRSPIHSVFFYNNKYRVPIYPDKSEYNYDGMVYCAKVPSGFIITRYKDSVSIEKNSEIRHENAYATLLEKLGMDDLFEHIGEYPALMGRVEYIENFLSNKELSKSHFILSLIMFSLFVEHISLFGQFLVIMSFNKHKNMFKGISNAIEATSKEEEIHGRFGIALYGILKEEHPELFTEEFYQELTTLADSALKAEKDILHWIFEEGDLDFIDLATAENYIIHRYNNSLEILGIEAPYLVDEKLLDKTRWFDQEVLSGKENDFFYKRSTDYSKKQKQITADDLF